MLNGWSVVELANGRCFYVNYPAKVSSWKRPPSWDYDASKLLLHYGVLGSFFKRFSSV